MKKFLFAFALTAFVTLSANCGMKNCEMKDCKMSNQNNQTMNCNMKDCKIENCNMSEMKKEMKAGSCGAGKCGAAMMNKTKDSNAKECGCGMTIESCIAMMPSCEYRDGKKK